MKKLFVVLFFTCLALGDWQQSGEIILPKGIQVNDLTTNYSGEIWILSASSILKLEGTSKSPLLVQEIQGGKILAADDYIYIVDNLNRLSMLDPAREDLAQPIKTTLNSPNQISVATADNKRIFITLEPEQLTFVTEEKIVGTISTRADKFSIIPAANYSSTETPFFTLDNNRIYSWSGGTYINTENYTGELLYSASQNILDFTADQSGNLFVLFSDSIVVLNTDGNFKRKIDITHLSPNSKILNNPTNNNLILFDQLDKTLKILSSVSRDEKGDIIVLNKNTPNPVDNYTKIEFTINQPLSLTITVYNLIGEPVKVIARGYYPKGTHQIIWNADDESGHLVPNGVYFYRLESIKGVAIRQLIVLR
ncbi:hypothetical protein AMJ52_02695 [candidate division TA06 bacterium DG_78]|uniref:FlgD Ig-like domain-containing protein n=1 Tax=candidate division TA06 bacterium DG_78 TaxID=1703772 RepID=A0A0S7YGI7_UNCT6|nr:MAG: hypothetical protein AMJ52_02695 [candidate division TA06 bacterium DG_78]